MDAEGPGRTPEFAGLFQIPAVLVGVMSTLGNGGGWGELWISGELSGPQAGMVGAGRGLKHCVISSGAQPAAPRPDLLPLVQAPPWPGFLLLPRHRALLPSSTNQPRGFLSLQVLVSLASNHEWSSLYLPQSCCPCPHPCQGHNSRGRAPSSGGGALAWGGGAWPHILSGCQGKRGNKRLPPAGTMSLPLPLSLLPLPRSPPVELRPPGLPSPNLLTL